MARHRIAKGKVDLNMCINIYQCSPQLCMNADDISGSIARKFRNPKVSPAHMDIIVFYEQNLLYYNFLYSIFKI